MAPLTVKKPEVIVLEMVGTFATKGFTLDSKERRNFFRLNLQEFTSKGFSNKDFKQDIKLMKLQETLHKERDRVRPIPPPPLATARASMSDKVTSVINWFNWKLENDRECPALSMFVSHFINWGYSRGIVKTPIYNEVPAVLKKWKEVDKVRVVFLMASKQNYDQTVTMTDKGNLGQFLGGCVKVVPRGGQRGENNYEGLANLVKCSHPSKVLLITRLARDAMDARNAGLRVVLIVRSDFEPDADKKVKAAQSTRKGSGGSSNLGNVKTSPIGVSSSSRTALNVLDSSLGALNVPSDEEMGMNNNMAPDREAITVEDLQEFPFIRTLSDLQFAPTKLS